MSLAMFFHRERERKKQQVGFKLKRRCVYFFACRNFWWAALSLKILLRQFGSESVGLCVDVDTRCFVGYCEHFCSTVVLALFVIFTLVSSGQKRRKKKRWYVDVDDHLPLPFKSFDGNKDI